MAVHSVHAPKRQCLIPRQRLYRHHLSLPLGAQVKKGQMEAVPGFRYQSLPNFENLLYNLPCPPSN